MRRRSLMGSSLTLLALLFCSPAAADPPDRVARVSFLSGPVSFRRATVDEWVRATLNYPMTTGDNVWTDAAGRAELQLGSSVVRLAANTSLGIPKLDDRAAQFRLAQGTLAVSVSGLGPEDVAEVDTPNGAVSLEQPGFYRIDVRPAGDEAIVTVRRGVAVVSTETTALEVDQNQSAVLTGLDESGDTVHDAVHTDEWEDWCQSRDRRVDNVMAQVYVSRDVIGYDDLDKFGTWQTDTVYGPIWIPRVRAKWAPYRFGHWVWIEPWGWTWIDDAPWGFAPSHYGRWVSRQGRWAWVPGDILARPVYAPALVAFVAGNANWPSALGIESPVAWFPLGPGEPFIPVHHASPGYVRALNAAADALTDADMTHVAYVNRSVRGAMTAVPQEAFVEGQPLARVAVPVPPDLCEAAPIVGTSLPVAPEAVSVLGQHVPGVAPAASILNRRIVVRTLPPPVAAPFATREPI